MESTIFLRAHTETAKHARKQRTRNLKNSKTPKWPDYALVFDCETTTDEKQSLTFGSYRLLRSVNGRYVETREEGFFHDDVAPSRDVHELNHFADLHAAETSADCPKRICVRSRSEFIMKVFFPNVLAGTMIVGFNLPFDIARIADDARKARRLNEDWSFVMSRDLDPRSGKPRDNPFVPRIKITRKDGKFAFIRLSGVSMCSSKSGKRLKPYAPGRFLDLRTLGWALRNVSYSLDSACKAFNVKGKLEHNPTGRVTSAEIAYCRQDIRATVGLLNALRADFDCHPIDLRPERTYSPATIAKAYLREMGLVPPSQKFRLSPKIQGIAAQAYFGGRAECRIRRAIVPVVHTDFKSEYPTVNTLMGLWQLLTAEQLLIEPATAKIRELVLNLRREQVFERDFWKQLRGYALVRPDGDILPVRTSYSGQESNLGVNILTSKEPIWLALPDVVALTILSGKPPKIVRAFRIVPKGQQRDLKTVALRGKTVINPKTDDFFKVVIESRERVKGDETLSESEREALGFFLKILANSGSYGLFIETTPKRVRDREKMEVFSGESYFPTTSQIVEDKGRWYCPVISSLITSAGRLLLASLECEVTDAGGSYLFCDTDSMAIVASKTGGLVACPGGSHFLRDGREAIKALSYTTVQKIVRRFERLNPYAFTGSILKVEKDSLRRRIFGYAISAKRYCLFTRESRRVSIETASSHGLGHLYMPNSGFDERAGAPNWAVEAWRYIVSGVLRLPRRKPLWFKLPGMMRIAITTPQVFKMLQARQSQLPYRNRVKPFNFILSPQIARLGLSGFPVDADPDHFTLVAPFTSVPSRWFNLSWVNVHDGKPYTLAPIEQKRPCDASPALLEDLVAMHEVHPESKSLAPDGTPCNWHTSGLLKRTPVTAHGRPRFIGKETDRRWEQDEDISLLCPVLPEYRPNETAGLAPAGQLQDRLCKYSVRDLARKARLSPATVQAAKSSKRIQKGTGHKLLRALGKLETSELERDSIEPKAS
jgi:hypothetical protein